MRQDVGSGDIVQRRQRNELAPEKEAKHGPKESQLPRPALVLALPRTLLAEHECPNEMLSGSPALKRPPLMSVPASNRSQAGGFWDTESFILSWYSLGLRVRCNFWTKSEGPYAIPCCNPDIIQGFRA